MCRVTLSRPIPVAALVGRYLTNKLIGHGPIPDRRSFAPQEHAFRGDHQVLPALSQRSRSSAAIPESGVRYPCIPHPFATNLPSGFPLSRSVRLACLSHAASVRSEPGSNSSVKFVSGNARPCEQRTDGQIRFKALTLSGNRENESCRLLEETSIRFARPTSTG